MSAEADGHAALAALDQALAEKPARNDDAFRALTEHLCAMRDRLIAEHRKGGGDPAVLERVNAVISIALAGHFPLGDTPWKEIGQARRALQELLAEI